MSQHYIRNLEFIFYIIKTYIFWTLIKKLHLKSLKCDCFQTDCLVYIHN